MVVGGWKCGGLALSSLKNRGADTSLRKTDCLSMFCSPATTSFDSKPNTHNPEGRSPLPFGVLPPRLPLIPNCLAGLGCRAVQVGTAAMSNCGSRWSQPVRGHKLHKVLRYGK